MPIAGNNLSVGMWISFQPWSMCFWCDNNAEREVICVNCVRLKRLFHCGERRSIIMPAGIHNKVNNLSSREKTTFNALN